MKKLIVLFILLLPVMANAQKEVQGSYSKAIMYEDKDFVPRAFQKIMIVTGLHDLDKEEKIKKEFVKLGIVTVSAIDLLPPIKEYTQEEKNVIYKSNNIDGVVKFEIVDKTTTGFSGVGSTSKVELKLSLQDVTTDKLAVMFIGHTLISSLYMDKAQLNFLKNVMKHFKPVLTNQKK